MLSVLTVDNKTCRTMLLLSDTYSMVPILVHEFATEPCDPEPQPILTRARLYRVSLPPDQLNPNGFYDGNLDEAFLTRFDRKKKTGRADLRASAKRIKLPSPGELP
jgi:ribonuclease Z